MQRLKTRPQFQATMAGETVARTAHFALHRLVLGDVVRASLEPGGPSLFGVPGVWLGAMTPKRWARRAVTRNAIKRQIYAVAAALEPQLPPDAHVVRLRAAFDRKQFLSASSDALKQAVRTELLQLFERAALRSSSPWAGVGMMQRLLILLVKGYRLLLSPWLGSACRFEPTCSQYSLQALQQHGAAAGVWLTVGRLARCHPWCDGGHDPVPQEAPRATRLFSRLIAPASSTSSPKKSP